MTPHDRTDLIETLCITKKGESKPIVINPNLVHSIGEDEGHFYYTFMIDKRALAE